MNNEPFENPEKFQEDSEKTKRAKVLLALLIDLAGLFLICFAIWYVFTKKVDFTNIENPFKQFSKEEITEPIEPYSLKQLVEYSEQRVNELNEQGYHYEFYKDDYGSGMTISYFAGDERGAILSEQPMIYVTAPEAFVTVDPSIMDGEPIAFDFDIGVGSENDFTDAKTLTINGDNKSIDLSENSLYVSFMDYYEGMYYSDIYAQYMNNFNYSEDKMNEIFDLCSDDNFSYHIRGSFDIENELPNDYGKNLMELAKLYRELHNLYNGIPLE